MVENRTVDALSANAVCKQTHHLLREILMSGALHLHVLAKVLQFI